MKQSLLLITLMLQLSLPGVAQFVNQGSLFVSPGTQLVTKDDFTNTGTVTNTGIMSFSANLTNNGAFDGAQGDVQLVGSTTQTVGGTTSFTVLTLTLQNTAAGQAIVLGVPVSVSQTATFTDGILKTSATNLLILLDNAQALSASNASHTVGPVRKLGDDVFTFPLGNGSAYRPASLSVQGTASDAFTAEYIESPPAQFTSVSSCLAAVSDKEYWQIDHTTGSGSARIGLAYQNVATGSPITSSPAIRVARLNGSQWGPISCTANGGASLSLVSTDGFTTTFGAFTLGRSISDLTVTLLIDNLNFDPALVGVPRDFIVSLTEVDNLSSTGTITLKVAKLTAFTITYGSTSGNSSVNGGIANNNSNWTFSEDANYITAQTTMSVPGLGKQIVGFSIARKASIPPSTIQSINVTIVPNAGGEQNFANNIAVTTLATN